MKIQIHFYLDAEEICSSYLNVPEYKILGAAKDYIKENYAEILANELCLNYTEMLTDELYEDDVTADDFEWIDEIIERFSKEGVIKVESIISLGEKEDYNETLA